MIETGDVVVVPYDKVYGLNANGFCFRDNEGRHGKVDFKECALNYYNALRKNFGARISSPAEENDRVGFMDERYEIPYFELTAKKTVVVIFIKPERRYFMQRTGAFFRAIKNRINTDRNRSDFFEFYFNVKSFGWRFYGLG